MALNLRLGSQAHRQEHNQAQQRQTQEQTQGQMHRQVTGGNSNTTSSHHISSVNGRPMSPFPETNSLCLNEFEDGLDGNLIIISDNFYDKPSDVSIHTQAQLAHTQTQTQTKNSDDRQTYTNKNETRDNVSNETRRVEIVSKQNNEMRGSRNEKIDDKKGKIETIKDASGQSDEMMDQMEFAFESDDSNEADNDNEKQKQNRSNKEICTIVDILEKPQIVDYKSKTMTDMSGVTFNAIFSNNNNNNNNNETENLAKSDRNNFDQKTNNNMTSYNNRRSNEKNLNNENNKNCDKNILSPGYVNTGINQMNQINYSNMDMPCENVDTMNTVISGTSGTSGTSAASEEKDVSNSAIESTELDAYCEAQSQIEKYKIAEKLRNMNTSYLVTINLSPFGKGEIEIPPSVDGSKTNNQSTEIDFI